MVLIVILLLLSLFLFYRAIVAYGVDLRALVRKRPSGYLLVHCTYLSSKLSPFSLYIYSLAM